MFATQINPIVAMAAQVKTVEDRATAARLRAERSKRQRAAYYRSRAKSGRSSSASALPAVATIH